MTYIFPDFKAAEITKPNANSFFCILAIKISNVREPIYKSIF